MKTLNILFFITVLVAGASAQTTWNIDQSHSTIGFAVGHMGVSEVEGDFKDFTGNVVSKTPDFNGAQVSFTAKAASIDTDNEKRNAHLTSPDFFDAEKHPEISFKGNLVKAGKGYKLSGDLTMHGVTKKVDFDVTYGGTVDTGRGVKAGFKLVGKLNRKDYGLTWENKVPTGELVVGDVVEINCKIELDKQA